MILANTLTKIQNKLLHIHPFIISLVKTKRTELNKILTGPIRRRRSVSNLLFIKQISQHFYFYYLLLLLPRKYLLLSLSTLPIFVLLLLGSNVQQCVTTCTVAYIYIYICRSRTRYSLSLFLVSSFNYNKQASSVFGLEPLHLVSKISFTRSSVTF